MTRKDYVMLAEAAGQYFALGRPEAEASGATELITLIMLRLKADNQSFSIKQFIENMALTIGGEDKLAELVAAAGIDMQRLEDLETEFEKSGD